MGIAFVLFLFDYLQMVAHVEDAFYPAPCAHMKACRLGAGSLCGQRFFFLARSAQAH